MTTTANRNKYHHMLPWRELPSTFRDAIKLCHRLGFEYLLVDSLCIIEGDEQDWLREASNKAGIYSISMLTLAMRFLALNQDIGRKGHSGRWVGRAWTFQEWSLSPRYVVDGRASKFRVSQGNLST